MLRIIYQPSGPAREYAELACNVYNGCTHACTYCYAPATMHKIRQKYFKHANPKKDIITRVRHNAETLSTIPSPAEILLSFIGDPYQPMEADLGLACYAIKTFKEQQLPLTNLTKICAVSDRLRHYSACALISGASRSYASTSKYSLLH